jgi:hypothetical protein
MEEDVNKVMLKPSLNIILTEQGTTQIEKILQIEDNISRSCR